MGDKSVSIEFLGDASSLVDAIQDASKAMADIQTQSLGFASSMANVAVKQLAPIAAAVGGAFAYKEALKAFSASDLPGADDFNDSMKETKESLKKVAEAVGEFLAPSAEWAARMIRKITDPLADLIRKFTAFKNSAVEFMKVLGGNAWEGMKQIIPTLQRVSDAVTGLFTGPGRDWSKDIERFRKYWNQTWANILDYTAPIIVAAGGAIEAVFKGIEAAAYAIWEAAKEAFGYLADVLNDYIPAGAGDSGKAIADLAAAIQAGLITALVGVEFAVKNWPLSFGIATTAIMLGVEQLRSSFSQLGSDLWENMKWAGEEMVNVFNHFLPQIQSAFSVMGDNITMVMGAVFDAAMQGAKNTAIKMAIMLTNPFQTMKRYAGNMSKGEEKAWDMGMAAFPTLVKPKFGEMKGFDPFEGYSGGTGMPGFKDRPVSDKEIELKAGLDTMLEKFKDGFGEFLPGRMKEIEEATAAFKAKIMENLPGVTGTPEARDLTPDVSSKYAGALQMGSSEAYSAILKATGGGDESLKEAKKTNKVLERIEGKLKPPVKAKV